MLCRVRRVGAFQATLALPHGMTGFCSLDDTNDVLAASVRASRAHSKEADDAEDDSAAAEGEGASSKQSSKLGMSSFLAVGQYVLACVTKVGSDSMFDQKPAVVALAQSLSASSSAAADGDRGNRRIELSLRPELCNQGLTVKELRNGSLVHGYVRSVEDNGYIVATGIAGVSSCFLPFSQSDGTCGQAGTSLSKEMSPGSPVVAAVWSINRDTGVVSLSCQADRVAALVSREPLHTIYTIKPGQLVSAAVDKVLPNGLAVTFLAFFHATVHQHHLPRPAHALWAGDYSAGQEIRARILYVDPAEKTIALSAAPHVVGYGRTPSPLTGCLPVGVGGPAFDVEEGGKVTSAVVLRVDPGVGMLIGWGSVADAAAVEAAGAAAKAGEEQKKAAKAAEKAAKKAAKFEKKKEKDAAAGAAAAAAKKGKKGAEDDDSEEEGEEEAEAEDAAQEEEKEEAAASSSASSGPAAAAAALLATGKKLPLEDQLRVSSQWGRTAYVHISRAGVPAGKTGSGATASGSAASIGDDKVEHIERLYRPGQTVAARLLSFAGLEGHALASTKAAVVDAAVLKPSDVTVGAVLEGTVQEVLALAEPKPGAKPVDFAAGKGVVAIIRLGEGVTGIITAAHVADLLPSKSFTNPKQRAAFLKGVGLSAGAKITVRVLSVDARSGQIQLTLKKTLLTSALPVISGYQQAYDLLKETTSSTAALVTHGFVTGLREAGVVVTFYNNTSGFISSTDLVEQGVVPKALATELPPSAPAAGASDEQPPRGSQYSLPIAALQRVYTQGQVVKVRVVSVATRKERIRLSVGLTAPVASASSSSSDAAAPSTSSASWFPPSDEPVVEMPTPEPGTFVTGTVIAADEGKKRLLVKVTHAGAAPEASEALPAGAALFADLPFSHLSDGAEAAGDAEATAAAYPAGTALRGLLVLQQLAKAKHPHKASAGGALPPPVISVTAKPLLRYAASPSAPGRPSDMLPATVDVLRPGLLVAGYVASVTAFAAFVRFLGGCTGAAPRSRWPKHAPSSYAAADGAVAEGSETEQYHVGQTVLAVVEKVSAGGDEAASKGRFTLSLLPDTICRMLPSPFFTENVATHGLDFPAAGLAASSATATSSASAPASAAATYLRGALLQQELLLAAKAAASSAAADENDEEEQEENASAAAPSRLTYRPGSTVLARVKAASGQGLIVEVAPPASTATASADAEAERAPVLGFALSPSTGSAPAVGSIVPVTVLDVSPEKGVLHVALTSAASAAGSAPASADSATSSAKAGKKRQRPTAATASAEAPSLPSVHTELTPPPALPSALKLGDVTSVTVLLKPSPLYAVVRVGGSGEGAPVGYAAISDLVDPLTSAPVEVGQTYDAVITQLPAAAESGSAAADTATGSSKKKKKPAAAAAEAPAPELLSPAASASQAVGGLLLLSLVTPVLAARKGTTKAPAGAAAGKGKASSSSAGRSGVAVESLLPGMTVTARVKAPRQPAAAAKHDDSDASDDDDEDSSDADAKGKHKGGKKKPSASAASSSGLAHAISLQLVGVLGRYEAGLSLAECIDVDVYSGKSLEEDAAAEAGLARFNALSAASAAGTEVKVKIVSISWEMRSPYDKRSRSTSSDTVSTIPFYRIAVTLRPSDMALPDLHLSSHRPAWAAPTAAAAEGSASESQRVTSEQCVIAASSAALAAAGPACLHLPPSSSVPPQSLVPGAVGFGVVEGCSSDGAYLWIGLGGGVHGRAFALECGDDDVIRDAATGELRITPEAAAALSAPRLSKLTHPLGSLVPVVLTSVDTGKRRADVSIRAARVAAAVATKAVTEGAAVATAAGGKKKQKTAAAAAAAAGEGPSFASAAAAVARWLASRPDVGRPAPGQIVLARVAAPPGGSAPGSRYPSTATSLRLQLTSSSHVHGRVDVTHIADRTAWTSKPLSSYVDGMVVRAVVLPGSSSTANASKTSSSSSSASSAPELELSLRPSFIQAAIDAAAAPAPSPAAPAVAAGGKRKRKESNADVVTAAASSSQPGGLAAAAAKLASLDAEERAAAGATGAKVSGYVVSVSDKGCFVRLARGTTARVLLKLLSDAFVRAPASSFPPGKLVTGVVTSSEPSSGRYDMSLRLSDIDPEAAAAAAAASGGSGKASAASASASTAHLIGFSDLSPGAVLDGAVTKVADYGVFVALDGTDRNAAAPAVDGADGVSEKPAKPRSSSNRPPVPISGLVHVSEVDDLPSNGKKAGAALAKLRTEVTSRFTVGDRVRVVVVTVDAGEKKLSLSMRPSRLQAAEEAGDEDEGSEEEGEGDVDMEGGGSDDEGAEEDGNIELEEADDEDDDEGEEQDEEGSEDEEKDDDEEDAEDDSDEGDAAPSRPQHARKASSAAAGIYAALDSDDDEDDASDDEEGAAPKGKSKAAAAASKPLGRAAPAAGNASDEDEDEDVFAAAEGDDSDGDEGTGSDGEGGKTTASKAAKRRARARAAAEEEAETSRREKRLVSGEAEASPETVEDFERLVATSPHSSLAWIRYMAWQLSIAETGKAREVAQRALDTISYRQEEERLNVWTAWMNLEATYGTPASLSSVFARAQQAADPKAVHLALLGIYQRAGADKATEAEALFALTAKKFGRDSKKVWAQWAAFKFRRGDAAGARALLPRALQQLPKRKHVETISQFALLEYAFSAPASGGSSSDASSSASASVGPYGLGSGGGSGSQERGRTMLQGLLDAVPKRLDIWSVYLDQEIAAFARRHGAAGAAPAKGKGAAAASSSSSSARSDDLAFIRSIFDRVLTLRLSSKKMKFLFKRYLAFEAAHGDAAGVAKVQGMARSYVESLVEGAKGATTGQGSDDEDM